MRLVEDAMILSGATADKEDLFWVIGKLVMGEFMNYCNRDDIPEEAEPVLLQMMLTQYNRLGTEGITSQSFANVSEGFEGKFYGENTIKQLNHFRKARFF